MRGASHNMEHPAMSAPFARFLGAALLLALVSCAGNSGSEPQLDVPHIFGGSEVPEDVRNAPRAVAEPSEESRKGNWQRLGDVPARPSDFTPQLAIDLSKREMDDDRTEARTLRQDFDNPPFLVTPPMAQSW